MDCQDQPSNLKHEADFISATELAVLTGCARKSIYTWHSSKSGPLAAILTKVGGRLGAWRDDYEMWKLSQRKMGPTAAMLAERVPASIERILKQSKTVRLPARRTSPPSHRDA